MKPSYNFGRFFAILSVGKVFMNVILYSQLLDEPFTKLSKIYYCEL